jgi:GTP cyclohydrolase I
VIGIEDMNDLIQVGMKLILEGLNEKFGLDLKDPNFTDTPKRVSRMYDEIFSGIKDTEEQVKAILASSFPSNYDQMILVRDIETFSMCPHHFLPVHYHISVAYIPAGDPKCSGKVLGISKLARLAEILAKRPVLQEQLTEDITRHLMTLEGCRGAACIVKGTHYCMVMRGVKKPSATTITSSLKGVFFDKPEARQEFLELAR